MRVPGTPKKRFTNLREYVIKKLGERWWDITLSAASASATHEAQGGA